MPTVVVYSNVAALRERVRATIGRRPAPGIDGIEYLDAAVADEVIRAVDEGLADLLILDGEAWPTGGLGLCRELKNSAAPCPPVVVLTGRRDDAWLAKWSQADVVIVQPIDPVELAHGVVTALAGRAAAVPDDDPELTATREYV